jgi:hypothetical protein
MMLTVSRVAFGISAAVNAMPDRCTRAGSAHRARGDQALR